MTTWDMFRNSGGWPIESHAEEAARAANRSTTEPPQGDTDDEEGDRDAGHDVA